MALAALLVGGCSAADSGGPAKNDSAGAPAAAPANPGGPTGAAAPQVSGAPAAAGVTPVADTHLIAYTAQLTLNAQNVSQVLAKARELATNSGGYVGGEQVYGSPGNESGQLVLKIPSAAYQQTLDQLAALGEVSTRKSQADDLTQQVADVASRVQTQQASVERVRALMAQAKSLSEITSLESELSRREADLESLQKQQKELSARTSYSTVTLEVHRAAASPTPPATPAPKAEGFGGSVGSALGGGWHVLVVIARALAVAIAALAPFLLVLGVPAALGYRYWRRRHPRPAASAAPDAEPTGFEPPEAEPAVSADPSNGQSAWPQP
ncbi:DUF4349 domain-containing protein [Kitasatospora sp. SUK 42]|uniref:DUF4349 domain-containing protein n=1 Tax=Kitasatospora sp. SUK 42 TaxID=1588882 RepID=UPI0018C986BE|nr:DUF4349 domain-containing protein [Kitasatospora sp. SUK 42]MBV2151500.1 DUF4349 domain-containing protein [Kitasatospora sp. SUK 42]